MMSKHLAHLTSLPFRLWHLALALYMIVVVNFDALHRKAIFESKGDKLSSSADSRIRTWKSQVT